MLGNSFGRAFRVTACGESYGGALLTICDGVPAGLPLTKEDIQEDLDRRRPGQTEIDSPRKETDQVEIVAGMRDGRTTGAPVGLVIHNVDTEAIHVQQYRDVKELMRPGHAEYTYFAKYGKFTDWCGAGRASGRETAGRVAAGGVAKKILDLLGIEVVGYVKELAGISVTKEMTFEEIRDNRFSNQAHCPDPEAAEKMIKRTIEIRDEGDTCGGIIELIARNVPPGLGEPVFDKLSADIAKGLMSVPSVKGVEIGAGFAAVKMKGSECNDIPYLEDGKIKYRTNNSGGLDGGISNGDDIVVRLAIKPTSTISKDQTTVNFVKMEETILSAITRRDATICPRAVPVAEAMMAIAICDHLILWKGLDTITALLRDH